MSQRESHYLFETGEIASDHWEVMHFEGKEVLSDLFYFDIEVVSTDPSIAYKDVVNKNCILTFIRDGQELPLHGLAMQMRQGRQIGKLYLYQVRMVPRVWAMSLGQYSRVFQSVSLKDILNDVLKKNGFKQGDDFEINLSATYPQREFVVQYQESDLNFLRRLMEHEGILFYFDHETGRDRMIITDKSIDNPHIDAEDLVYHHEGGLTDDDDTEIVTEFYTNAVMQPGKVIVKDYNYRTPETNLKAEKDLSITPKMPSVEYEFAPEFLDIGQGQHYAARRQEEYSAQFLIHEGKSDSLALRAGHIFSMLSHYRDDFNIEYLLLEVLHEGSQGTGLSQTSTRKKYQASFTCIPAKTPFRPKRLTPIPRIHGVINAKIETSGGPYAYLDDNGEYHVKLPFDLESAAEGQNSLPVRLSQPYSGSGYGIHFPNHANTDVVLAFYDGDVDRPIALGTAPNPSNVSPVTGGNKHQNVIRTWGKNELTFDDKQGSENIYLFATKDNTIEITHDRNEQVGHDEAVEIGHNQTHVVKNNRTRRVTSNEDVTIGGNQSLTIGASRTTTISANETTSVGANSNETVGTLKSVSVGAAMTLTIGAAYNLTVGALKMEEVGAASVETVGAAKSITVGGNMSIMAGGNAGITAGGNITDMASQKISQTAGKDFTVQAGTKINIQAGSKIQLNAGSELSLVCGSASITLKSSGKIVISGSAVEVKASGNLTMKGSQIKAN